MNIRILSAILLAVVSVSCSAERTLTFKNKTNVTVRVVPGSSAIPPYDNPVRAMETALAIYPGQEGTVPMVPNDNGPQVMFWQESSPEVAYVYEFKPTDKRLIVQLVDDNNRLQFSSVPFTFNSITKEDIISKGVVDLKAKADAYTPVTYNKLQFKNKADFPIRVAPGSKARPPYKDPLFDEKSSLNVKPGQTGNVHVVTNDKNPQIMFWKDGSPETAYVYEFNAKPGKSLEVQVGKDMKLSSVSFTYNTITQGDIVLIDTINLNTMRKK